MSRNDGDIRPISSGAASRTSAAADVSFAARGSSQGSRIPRWKRRSSRSPSKKGSNSKSNSIHEAQISEKARGKRASSYDPDEEGSRASTPSHSQSRKTGGFLLEPAFANGYPSAQEGPHHRYHHQSNIQQERRRSLAKRVSDGSSHRSSPLLQQLSNEKVVSGASPDAARPSMDPAQLVQMALNLSESRRRNVSSTLPMPISPAGARRLISGSKHGSGLMQPGALINSLPADSTGQWGQPTSGSPVTSQQYGDTFPVIIDEFQNHVFSFSPATLSRAEKARRYFDLAKEHRRLLEHLPPLKSDSSAAGNYSIKATSSPGSAHYDVTRIPSKNVVKRNLGRPYNPLQALRNRRLRNRERRPLTAPPDAWQETSRIRGWIDGVEAASKEPSFQPGEDQVRLPTFSGESEGGEVLRPEGVRRHHRNDTVSSVITRPENGWTIEPAELLADVYWVEKDDNKTVVEDRHGNRIFPNRARRSVEVPRRSKETARRNEFNPDGRGAQDEIEDDDRSRSSRRNRIPIPGRLRRHHVSRSASISSISSHEGRQPPPFRYGDSEGGNENIAPLERHMKRMISREEHGESDSPETAEHAYSWKTQSPDVMANREFAPTANNRPSSHVQRHRRARSADGRFGSIDHGMSKMDDMTSGSPDSPCLSAAAPADEPSTKQKRANGSGSKHKSSNLPIFRSRSKERHQIEHSDFADYSGAQLSPVLSTESISVPGRPSLDSFRPPQTKRNSTNDSGASGARRTNANTTLTDVSVKDSANAMGRRLGRIGELVRTEGSRLGDRLRGGRDREPALDFASAPLDMSDADHREREHLQSWDEFTDDQVSPRQSLESDGHKPKYHTSGLPTFNSPAPRDMNGPDALTSGNHTESLAAKSRSRAKTARAAQSHLLVPPTMNPPADDASDSDIPAGQTTEYRPKSASQTHLSFGAAPAIRTGERRGNMTSSHDGRRHWSISDPSHQTQPQLSDKVAVRDIARVRALLLASGIKAQEIHNQAETARDPPLPLMVKVAKITGNNLGGLTRKEENVVAGRLLSESISSSLAEFEKRLEHFQSTTAKDLGSQLEELSHRASDQLTKLVHETSEDVDAFNVELTTKQPQEVKRVDEAVDEMFRQRRRQFRLVRRTGFKMLEWLVLGIMWWAWFVVVLFNTGRRCISTIMMAFRWLLWF